MNGNRVIGNSTQLRVDVVQFGDFSGPGGDTYILHILLYTKRQLVSRYHHTKRDRHQASSTEAIGPIKQFQAAVG